MGLERPYSRQVIWQTNINSAKENHFSCINSYCCEIDLRLLHCNDSQPKCRSIQGVGKHCSAVINNVTNCLIDLNLRTCLPGLLQTLLRRFVRTQAEVRLHRLERRQGHHGRGRREVQLSQMPRKGYNLMIFLALKFTDFKGCHVVLNWGDAEH